MNRQMTLAEVPPSHRTDPVTSYKAAEKAAKGCGAWHKRIYRALLRNDRLTGHTTKELADLMAGGWYENYVKISRRMSEVVKKDWVRPVGTRFSLIGGGECVAYRANSEKKSEVENGTASRIS